MTRKKAVYTPNRIDKVIAILPHAKSKTEAFIQAGYSEKTARAKHTQINKQIERRLIQYEELGLPVDPFFNMSEVLLEYEKICKQDKDYSTKLRALTPILQKHQILPSENNSSNQAPILNITVRNVQIESHQEPVRVQAEIVQDEPITP